MGSYSRVYKDYQALLKQIIIPKNSLHYEASF